MCDPYMHCENDLLLTRRCLEIIDRYGFGLAIQTKSDRILRDLDLLKSINKKSKCVVQMTLTTADDSLCRIIEPNVCETSRRIEVLDIMRDEGIPAVVWLSPFLPYINDTMENFSSLMKSCIQADVRGIICFGIGTTIRDGDREYFYAALDRHFPGLKQKYIETYGNAYECLSDNHEALIGIFHEECEKRSVLHDIGEIFAYMQQFPQEDGGQLSLF